MSSSPLSPTWLLPFELKKVNDSDFTPLKNYLTQEFLPNASAIQSIQQLNALRLSLNADGLQTTQCLDSYYKYLSLFACLANRVPITQLEGISFKWSDIYNLKSFSHSSPYYEIVNIVFNCMSYHSILGAMEPRDSKESIKKSVNHFQQAIGVLHCLRKHLTHSKSSSDDQLLDSALILDYREKHSPLTQHCDLQLDHLQFLEWILWAHAEECYHDMAIQTNFAPFHLAQLAKQISIYYQDAYKTSEKILIRDESKNYYIPIIDSITGLEFVSAAQPALLTRYKTYCKIKMSAFKAIYSLYQSRYHHSELQYGEQVTRLQIASSICMNDLQEKDFKDKLVHITKSCLNHISELHVYLKRMCNLIHSELAQAKLDNDTIYHEPVFQMPMAHSSSAPNSSTKISSVTPKSLAKVIDMDVSSLLISDHPFKVLIPLIVQENQSMYDERKAEFLRQIIQDADKQGGKIWLSLKQAGIFTGGDIELSSMMNEITISPNAAIGNEFPRFKSKYNLESCAKELLFEVMEMVKMVKEQCNTISLESQFEQVRQLSQANQTLLDQIQTMIININSSIPPNSLVSQTVNSLLAPLQQEATTHARNLVDAHKSDEQIRLKLIACSSFVQHLLDLSEEQHTNEIKRVMSNLIGVHLSSPTSQLKSQDQVSESKVFSVNSQIGQHIQALKLTLSRIGTLLASHETLINTLRSALHQDSLIDELLLFAYRTSAKGVDNGRNELDALFHNALSKFHQYKDEIYEKFDAQDKLLAKLFLLKDQLYESFEMEEQSKANKARSLQDLLRQYSDEFTLYKQVLQSINQGIDFYNKCHGLLTKLSQKCTTALKMCCHQGQI